MLRDAEQSLKFFEFRCARENRFYVVRNVSGFFQTVRKCLCGISGFPVLIGFGKKLLPILGSRRRSADSCHSERLSGFHGNGRSQPSLSLGVFIVRQSS